MKIREKPRNVHGKYYLTCNLFNQYVILGSNQMEIDPIDAQGQCCSINTCKTSYALKIGHETHLIHCVLSVHLYYIWQL